jgi:hypothetical protein
LYKTAVSVVNRRVFRVISDFAKLGDAEAAAVRERLGENQRNQMHTALAAFLRLYPECPLARLCPEASVDPQHGDVIWMKAVLAESFDKTGARATHALATLVYVSMAQGQLLIQPGSLLSRLPEIETYPETKDSRLIASAVRSVTNTFFGPPDYDPATVWPKYFWTRCFQLEPCYFKGDEGGDQG